MMAKKYSGIVIEQGVNDGKIDQRISFFEPIKKSDYEHYIKRSNEDMYFLWSDDPKTRSKLIRMVEK